MIDIMAVHGGLTVMWSDSYTTDYPIDRTVCNAKMITEELIKLDEYTRTETAL